MNWLKSFWHNHVQKTLGTLMAALAGVDLVSSLAGYQADITAFLGAKAYAGLRCACALAVVIRAVQAKRAPLPEPTPESTR